MSKLDHLLSLVDSIDSKSNVLLQSFQDCSSIIQNISHNNNQISTFDVKISTNNSSVKNYYQFATELYDLNARASLFEHDLNHNDFATNKNIYSNLTQEFDYIRSKYLQPHREPYKSKDFSGLLGSFNDTVGDFQLNNMSMNEPVGFSTNVSTEFPRDCMDPGYSNTSRHFDTSRHMDPSTYIDPLDPSILDPFDPSGPSDSMDSMNSIPKSISISNMTLKPIKTKPNKVYKKKSHYKISNLFHNPILSPELSKNDSTDTIENLMDYPDYPESNDTTPELESLDAKPFMHNIDHFDQIDNTAIFDYEFNDNESTLSDTPSMEFENFESFLRKSRINLTQDSYPFAVKKSVSDASINIPAEQEQESETFQLNEQNDQRELKHTQKGHKFKFHNPIDNIKSKNDSLSPTVQSVYSTFKKSEDTSTSESLLTKVINGTPISSPIKSEPSPFAFLNFIHSPRKGQNGGDGSGGQSVRFNEKQDSVSGLFKSHSKVSIQSKLKAASSSSSSDSNSDFSCSSSGSNSSRYSSGCSSFKSSSAAKTGATSRSFIGTSLTDSFLQLMQGDSRSMLGVGSTPILTQQCAPLPPPPVNSRRYKRNKLEELKAVPKSKPIAVLNETRLKRLPHPKLSSSASSLILDSNKSFVVHGESSVFKKPMVTNFSNRNLQEALRSDLSL